MKLVEPTASRQYVGVRQGNRCVVTVNSVSLPPRTDLDLHCENGFDWGYFGAAPAQLALAIVADHCTGDEGRALRCYMDFVWHVVESLPHDQWQLQSADVEAVLRSIELATKKEEAVRRALKRK